MKFLLIGPSGLTKVLDTGPYGQMENLHRAVQKWGLLWPLFHGPDPDPWLRVGAEYYGWAEFACLQPLTLLEDCGSASAHWVWIPDGEVPQRDGGQYTETIREAVRLAAEGRRGDAPWKMVTRMEELYASVSQRRDEAEASFKEVARTNWGGRYGAATAAEAARIDFDSGGKAVQKLWDCCWGLYGGPMAGAEISSMTWGIASGAWEDLNSSVDDLRRRLEEIGAKAPAQA